MSGNDSSAAPRRTSFRTWAFLLIGAVVLIIAGSVAFKILDFGPKIPGPKTNDLSQPTLVVSIQRLGHYTGAEGTFQQEVELDDNLSWLPDFLYDRHTTFIAVGTVDAYVDFDQISGDNVQVDQEKKSVVINLPRAVLDKPNIDNDKSHVIGENRGFAQWVHDIFGNDPNRQQQFYKLGEDKIYHAALESDLREQADDSVRSKLTELCQLLGYTSVTINFVDATPTSSSD